MAKENVRLFVIAGILVAALVFVATTETALWGVPDTEVSVQEVEAENRQVFPEDLPSRLRVPAIEVDAHVQEVGKNALGNMAAPSNFTDVGWYKHGVPPGFLGSAVITGHVDNAIALPGVFKDLHELKIGDDVYVEKKDGSEMHFKVVEIQTYPYKLVPLKILFSRRDLPRLNLITCGGTWLPGERSYDKRLVVYTELVSD